MSHYEIIRSVDSAGKITIPKIVRESLDIKPGSRMKISYDDFSGRIVLQLCSDNVSFSAVSLWCDYKSRDFKGVGRTLWFIDKELNHVGFFINQIPITKEECKSALKYWDENRKPFLIHDNYVLPIKYNDDAIIYAISNANQKMVMELQDDFAKELVYKT